MTAHVGEQAELFALGALEPHERAAVEAHVRDCGRCSAALGRAEATIAALGDATVPLVEAPPRLAERLRVSAAAAVAGGRNDTAVARLRGWYAVAALFLIGVFVTGSVVENVRLRRGLAADDHAFATIATSHFLHVGFNGSVPAKVLYARDGTWAYVIVAVPDCRCRVVTHGDGAAHDYGTPQRHGTTETLFVAGFERLRSLALIDERGAVLATAALSYAAPALTSAGPVRFRSRPAGSSEEASPPASC